MADKTINTVLVLRNDSTTAWAGSGYILRSGEVGIGYLDIVQADESVKKVPVIKVGDGTNTWNMLPQAEGVFEKDVVLTAPLGKYEPTDAGFIKVEGSKGMTTSEFLMSALSAVKEPTITAPSLTLNATSGSRTVEIGSKISSLSWTGTFNKGTYEFGSKQDDKTYTKADGSGQTVTGYEVTCTLPGTVDQKEDGSVTLTNAYVVGASATNFASITSKCSWNASDRTPLNNVGEPTDGQLAAGSDTKTVNYSVTAYREGFFYGTTTTAITDPTTLTGWDIRNLYKTGKAYANIADADTNTAGKQVIVSVPSGAASIILACPKTSTGVIDVLNTTVNANMNEAFGLTKPTVVSVGGADATQDSVGDYAVDYNVWVYKPAEAYSSTATLTVTLG